MHKITYVSLIGALENNDTTSLIGKIDIETLQYNRVETLYYELPLIERIVLEIYKMLPLSDVEYYQQGTMRTIMELINKDSHSYFPENLIMILQKYFGDDGLRNSLFHVKDDVGNIEIDMGKLNYNELNFSLMQLLSILRDTCAMYSIDKIGMIELID